MEIYLVDGARSPFLKARSGAGPFSAADLAVHTGRALLTRQPFLPEHLDEVILGCAAPAADEVNIGRYVALRLGCGHKVTGWTVMRNCASGLQAIDSAMTNIRAGKAHLVLAGGVDALSRTPLLYDDRVVRWFAELSRMKTLPQRIQHFTRLPLGKMFAPVISLMQGLTDPQVGLLMGQTAEQLAARFALSREQLDAYSVTSHQRAAQTPHREIVPLVDASGKIYSIDDGVRSDATQESLSKLKAFFDRRYGRITAGNSSQITDGASLVLLASKEALSRWNLTPLAKLDTVQWAGLDPVEMGLGPVHAATPILQKHNFSLSDIDLWEINEAFAAQVLACLAAWDDADYCRQNLGLPDKLGRIPLEKLNVDGGAIALGHPVGASGARIVLHLAHLLRQRQLQRGIASICIGGGQGGALLVEACTKDKV